MTTALASHSSVPYFLSLSRQWQQRCTFLPPSPSPSRLPSSFSACIVHVKPHLKTSIYAIRHNWYSTNLRSLFEEQDSFSFSAPASASPPPNSQGCWGLSYNEIFRFCFVLGHCASCSCKLGLQFDPISTINSL
uniref:Uncharacterized protein n=1 Tax=Opuntia streptacantha TaxID=393608 RepID=A0A7C9AMK3_OPUST